MEVQVDVDMMERSGILPEMDKLGINSSHSSKKNLLELVVLKNL